MKLYLMMAAGKITWHREMPIYGAKNGDLCVWFFYFYIEIDKKIKLRKFTVLHWGEIKL